MAYHLVLQVFDCKYMPMLAVNYLLAAQRGKKNFMHAYC